MNRPLGVDDGKIVEQFSFHVHGLGANARPARGGGDFIQNDGGDAVQTPEIPAPDFCHGQDGCAQQIAHADHCGRSGQGGTGIGRHPQAPAIERPVQRQTMWRRGGQPDGMGWRRGKAPGRRLHAQQPLNGADQLATDMDMPASIAGGGIDLGFDYRSRMTALTGDEAEALGLMLASPHPALDRVGLGLAARRAGRKIVEGLAPDVRARIATAEQRFVVRADPHPDDDPRPPALARAVRERRVVQLRSRSRSPMAVHPVQLTFDGRDWDVTCGRTGMAHRRPDWADIAISSRRFEPE